MKNLLTYFILFFLSAANCAARIPEEEQPDLIINALAAEIKMICKKYESQFVVKANQISEINKALLLSENVWEKVDLLVQKDKLNTEILLLQRETENEISKVRYLKRLQIIKILYEKVLAPILGIEDLRNDERIEYVSGKHSVAEIKRKIDDGEFELGFILFPSDINEIKAIADAHLIMPPKSTYIEPKFRSGLVIYEL